jgi:polyhydroxyalkanoate synthesis regulator phasin
MTDAELKALKASISDKVMKSRIGAIATSTYAHVVRDHIAYAVGELAKKLENVTSFTVNGSEVTLEQFVTGIVDKQLSTYAKNDDLTSTNGNVTALTERVAELENDQADSRLTTAESNISSLQSAVFDTNGASLIAAIQEDIDEIEKAITNITGESVEVSSLSLESLYNDIGELKSTTTSQGESIANLNERVTELSQNPAQSADIESLQNSVETLEDQNLDARLKTIEESFAGSRLIRCHRKFIVNMEKVKVLQKVAGAYELILDNDTIAPIPVTKTYTENVLKHFQEESL